jgi:hypothetical protein
MIFKNQQSVGENAVNVEHTVKPVCRRQEKLWKPGVAIVSAIALLSASTMLSGVAADATRPTP